MSKRLFDVLNPLFNSTKTTSLAELTDFSKLSNYLLITTFEKGEKIVDIYSYINNISIIMIGDHYAFRHTAEGDMNILGIRHAPKIYGMHGLTKHDEIITTGVIALEQCVVITIPTTHFINELKQDYRLALFVIDQLTNLLNHDVLKMDISSLREPTDQVLNFIYERWLLKEDDAFLLIIDTPKYLISQYIGISERTLYRALKELSDSHLISLKKGKINVTKTQVDAFLDRISDFFY